MGQAISCCKVLPEVRNQNYLKVSPVTEGTFTHEASQEAQEEESHLRQLQERLNSKMEKGSTEERKESFHNQLLLQKYHLLCPDKKNVPSSDKI